MAAAVVLAIALAFGPRAVGGEARQASQAVTAGGTQNVFAPADVTVNTGGTVTWTNAGGEHNVRFDDGGFEQPAMAAAPPWSVSRRFDSAGTFRYYCERHAASMVGTVTVLDASAPGPPPPGGAPPTDPGPGAAPPPARQRLAVTLQVSDSTPRPGRRVRFSGQVRPQYDGRIVQIQRRARKGFRTVATTRLRDAGDTKSAYSRRLRILGDGVFRSRVAGDRDHVTAISHTRRLKVEQP